jgi:hypothetical protein
MRLKALTVLIILLATAAVPALADVEIPEEWVGVWELEIAVYECETNTLLFSTTDLDTICPGSVFEDPDPEEMPLECTGSADADSYTTHCEGSLEVMPGCTMNFVYDVTGTRDGDTYTSVATTDITYSGDCPDVPDTCQRTEVTGTRIGGAPNPCDGTPVEGRSWGTVKSLYR